MSGGFLVSGPWETNIHLGNLDTVADLHEDCSIICRTRAFGQLGVGVNPISLHQAFEVGI